MGASRFILVALSLLVATRLSGCGSASSESEPERLRIGVTIPPLAWVAQGLAPEGAEVSVLTPAGASPHAFEPSPASIARFVRADIVLRVGLDFDPAAERALATHANPNRREVIFGELLTEEELHAGHDHGPGEHHHDHDHGPVDPHLWLDPLLMARLVPVARRAIEAALEERGLLDDQMRAHLDVSEARLVTEISLVDADYHAGLLSVADRPIVCQHDAYFWLSRRYGLDVAAVIRPVHGVEPTAGDLAEAVRIVRTSGVSAIFTEPQLPGGAAARLAELSGARLLTLDPLGDGDWPAMMRANLDALVSGLTPAEEVGEAG